MKVQRVIYVLSMQYQDCLLMLLQFGVVAVVEVYSVVEAVAVVADLVALLA